jgi:hypothetical protein
VPETVVDHLEAVEVYEDHGEGKFGVAPGALQRVAEAIHEERAVGEARQRVVEGVVDETLLGEFTFGDVCQRAGHADDPALAVPHGHSAAEHPAVSPPPVQQAVFDLEVCVAAQRVRLNLRTQPRFILGMHSAQPLLGRAPDFGLRVAEHRFPARRVVNLARL